MGKRWRLSERVEADSYKSRQIFFGLGHSPAEIEKIFLAHRNKPVAATVAAAIETLRLVGHSDEEIRAIGKRAPRTYAFERTRLENTQKALRSAGHTDAEIRAIANV